MHQGPRQHRQFRFQPIDTFAQGPIGTPVKFRPEGLEKRRLPARYYRRGSKRSPSPQLPCVRPFYLGRFLFFGCDRFCGAIPLLDSPRRCSAIASTKAYYSLTHFFTDISHTTHSSNGGTPPLSRSVALAPFRYSTNPITCAGRVRHGNN